MKYTFRSETKTVYLNVDYKLYILSSSGTSLVNGKSTLNAVVRRISDGTEIQFDANCFTWKRHEQSESFTPITGITLEVDSSMLVNGSATFICEFSKEGLFWKDTATISITSTNQGANAPYQRTIYKVSENKPEKPGGNAYELPSGWSLQPPPRVNNWKVWASVAYVTFDSGNTPIYSEWSDPVEWTGDTVLPIVQWQWGSSDTYPPDKINSIILVDGKVIVWTDDSGSAAFVDSEASVWSDTIPPKPDGRPYLWKREYNWQHTSEEDEWFYYSVTGKGLPGSYQTIGYIIVGTNSVIFAGLDEDKNPTLSTIHIFIEDMSYYFQSIEGTMNEKSDVFYLVATVNEETGIGELDFAYIDYVSTGSTSRTAWKDHLTDAEITDGFVLAEIRMNGASIRSVAIITPRRFDAYEKTRFMEILNSGNMDDINVAAEALGVERVFTKVAALEAFVDALYANIIHFTNVIYAGSYNANGTNPTNGPGVYISALGELKAVDAILKNLEATSANIEGTFETSDSQGIILKSSKTSGSISAIDSETKYIAFNSYTGQIAGLSVDAEYIKLSGYDEWFFSQIPIYESEKFIFDGDFFTDCDIEGLPPLYDNDEEHDSKETFGKYILAKQHATNPSNISLWEGDSDGSQKTGVYTASFSLGNSSDERSIVLLSQKAVTYASSYEYGPRVQVKVEQVYSYTISGGSPSTQTATIKEWVANDVSLFGDFVKGNYIEVNDLVLPGISIGGADVTERTLKVTYTLNASFSQQSVGSDSIHTVVILPIEDLVPVRYNKAISPQESYEETRYNYLFIEAKDDWTISSEDLGQVQPAVVKSLLSGSVTGNIIEYTGPTASIYDSGKSLICTSSDMSGWVSAGYQVFYSGYKLYSQLSSLSEGNHDTLSSSYIYQQTSNTKRYISYINITDFGEYIGFSFYNDSSDLMIDRFYYYPDGRLANGTLRLDDSYHIELASSLRGVTTASLYPANSSANIGSTGNRYNSLYVDEITTSEINISATGYLPLINGWKLISRGINYVNPDADLVWYHVDFGGVFGSIPDVFVTCIRDDTYISNPSDFEDRNSGYLKDLDSTGVDVAVFGKLKYQLIAIGL